MDGRPTEIGSRKSSYGQAARRAFVAVQISYPPRKTGRNFSMGVDAVFMDQSFSASVSGPGWAADLVAAWWAVGVWEAVKHPCPAPKQCLNKTRFFQNLVPARRLTLALGWMAWLFCFWFTEPAARLHLGNRRPLCQTAKLIAGVGALIFRGSLFQRRFA